MVDAIITPRGQMDLLSHQEAALLQHSSDSECRTLFRDCTLAVLSTGVQNDDGDALLRSHQNFDIELVRFPRGVKLRLNNAPENAFVDGRIIEGIRSHLFAVVRDIIYAHQIYPQNPAATQSITDLVFRSLRNARALKPRKHPNLVVCWGGHSISGTEYDYSKEVGYRLGLRGLDICTGCGIGAMKGPMKGAHIAHAKQRVRRARYIGITEPGIIASEAPNAIVNELLIMPDIEKRLEAFVRLGHAIVVFPGGVGTAEEILYILGILLDPANKGVKLPLVFTGPAKSSAYFDVLDKFIGESLGEEAQALYQIILDDPIQVAKTVDEQMSTVRKNRRNLEDAYFFNWSLHIEKELQQPFEPSHENMYALNLNSDQSPRALASNLRRAFSGIVAGNVKPNGIRAIKANGPYLLKGDPALMSSVDKLLSDFATQGRMKLSGEYSPCYQLVK